MTPWTAAHQAPPSLGFSRQEHWSGLPFPSPMHESEKWKWSGSVVSSSQRPCGLQPTRLLCPWDFPGKSTGVGCHCFLHIYSSMHMLIPTSKVLCIQEVSSVLQPSPCLSLHHFLTQRLWFTSSTLGGICSSIFVKLLGITVMCKQNQNPPQSSKIPPAKAVPFQMSYNCLPSGDILQGQHCASLILKPLETKHSQAFCPFTKC